MKLAYLILAHNNPSILHRLVENIRCQNATIFIHIDSKSNIKQFSELDAYEDVIFIPHRVAVYWGDYSIVEATLNLLQFSHSYGQFDYYQLLSGADYPVRNNEVIVETLSSTNCEFMEYFKMPVSHKPLHRLENFWVTGAYNNPNRLRGFFLRALNKMVQQLAYIHKRNYKKHIGGLTPYAGSAWWTLTGECVAHILKFLENTPHYAKAFQYSLHADEMFFQTIVLNSPFREHIKPSLNYVDWRDRHVPSPPQISEEHLRILEDDPHFLFARKFTLSNAYLLDYIDQHLRKQNHPVDASPTLSNRYDEVVCH